MVEEINVDFYMLISHIDLDGHNIYSVCFRPEQNKSEIMQLMKINVVVGLGGILVIILKILITSY